MSGALKKKLGLTITSEKVEGVDGLQLAARLTYVQRRSRCRRPT